MPATILIGAQWGDEGKGRVADWLAADADIVARYAGGDNAGHTVTVGADTFKLHLIPSGILHPHVRCLIGAGTVINPLTILRELDDLAKGGIVVTPERLMIDARAHIITPAHLALDGASEAALGAEAIGTTKRGIGPAYSSKMSRAGIRAHTMLDSEQFGDELQKAIDQGSHLLQTVYGQAPLDKAALIPQYVEAARRLKPFIGDGVAFIHAALQAGKRVVCEGAQGTFLDIDHGMYPFVTSSSTMVGGALTGLGFGPQYVDRVVASVKAFSSKVGSGPFPTELTGALGDRLRGTGANPWDEYGSTTGRPRRCGWLDMVMLRYAVRLNGITELFLNKLDILSGLDTVKIAVAYQIDGRETLIPPYDATALTKVEPIYEELPGWSENIMGARHLAELPAAARRYVERMAELVGVPITAVGVGPARDQVILR